MLLPNGDVLMHRADTPYDPKKAHEYYIRTRQLKGRKKGGAKPTFGDATMRINDTFSVKVGSGKTVKLTTQQLSEQRAYAAHRVGAIKKKLAVLNHELKKRVAEAKKAEKEAAKPDTAAEKHDKARESKKFRDKHKQELKNKAKQAADKKSTTKKPTTDTVEGLKSTIKNVQKSLDAAVERQRALTSATKNG